MLNQWNEWLKRYPRSAGGLLFLITFLTFQGTLRSLFVFDDIPQILQNPFVTNPHLWPRIFVGSVWSFRGSGEHDNFYRPLQFLAYWVLYRLAGPNPAVFHLFHLLFYAATVWLVYRLGRELLQNHLAAFVGALLWAIHPQHVETVAWVSALPDAGSAFFYVLGILLFLRAEKAADHRASRHVLAALAYLPALFFKEMALTMPLLLLTYWLFIPPQRSWKSKAACWLPYLGVAAAYVAIRVAILGRFSQAPYLGRSWVETMAAALGALGQHAKLFFWPAHLSAFRTFQLGPSLRSPWPWLTLVVLVGALWLRKRQPVLGFLVAWWAVTLLPCLDVRQVSFPVADRFSFLPSVGLCLAVAYAGMLWLPRRMAAFEPAVAVIPGLALVISLWVVQDLRMIPHWHDNGALWAYSFRVSPDAALVHVYEGAEVQMRRGDLDGAAREFQTALRLNQASFRPLAGVTYDAYMGLGQIANLKGRTQEAVSYLEKALQLGPTHSPAYRALGSLYFPKGDYARAADYFQQAISINSQDLESRFFLGTCWMKLGKYREAVEQFRAAREIDPTYSEAYDAEARALEAAGNAAGGARVRGLKPKP